jgi:hypothetical protein
VNKILVAVSACAMAAAVLFGTAFFLTRAAPPDLSNIDEWTLVKNASVGSPERPLDLRVYLYLRYSTDHDPYDVRQNKIIVKDGNRRYEFMWPPDDEFAGSWIEVFQPADRSVAIVLFENEYAARVVLYEGGRFRYRTKEDEVVSPKALRYELASGVGDPRFVDTVGVAWAWNPARGFERVNVDAP